MWLFEGKEFTENDIGEYYGFVYRITNKINGRKYIGRKYLTRAGYKQVAGKRKKIRKASDWLVYWGSNKELLEDIKTHGEENFVRTILHLCKTRGECNYMELYEIVANDCLLRRDYYNSWVSAKIHRDHLKAIQKP